MISFISLLRFDFKRIVRRPSNYIVLFFFSFTFLFFDIMLIVSDEVKKAVPSGHFNISFLFIYVISFVFSYSGAEYKRKGMLETLIAGPVKISTVLWSRIASGFMPAFAFLVFLWLVVIVIVCRTQPDHSVHGVVLFRSLINAPLLAFLLQIISALSWINIKDERLFNMLTMIIFYPLFFVYFRYGISYNPAWWLEFLVLLAFIPIIIAIGNLMTKKESIVLRF